MPWVQPPFGGTALEIPDTITEEGKNLFLMNLTMIVSMKIEQHLLVQATMARCMLVCGMEVPWNKPTPSSLRPNFLMV